MRIAATALLLVLVQALAAFSATTNAVVNLSHYDRMRPDFAAMKQEGIIGVIHEATFPKAAQDEAYLERQEAATRAGLLWGAYHFADASDPVRQADHMLGVVGAAWRQAPAGSRPDQVLLVLDFEKNGHYGGGTMRVGQAVTFAERIRERTGKYPGIYSNELRIRQVLNNPAVTAEQRRVLEHCWLWVANYHYEPRAIAPWTRWHLWQYTGDGVCDLPRAAFPKHIANVRNAERNVFGGNRTELQLFWEQHGWNPQS